MAIRRSKPKKIRKEVKLVDSNLVAATQDNTTLHTVDEPSTTKRFIVDVSLGEDSGTMADDDDFEMGICITKPGETIPTLANMESEKDRWVWLTAGLTGEMDVAPVRIYRDMKIQRKVKAGEVITLAKIQTLAGKIHGTVTTFIDET